MTGGQQFKLFGVYVSRPVYDALAELVYEEAGVIRLEEYFDPSVSTVAAGDPGAEATDAIVSAVVEEFAELYDVSDFGAAGRVSHDDFVLVSLAARPETVAAARELFQAAVRIQGSDLRTVHTAILAAYLSSE